MDMDKKIRSVYKVIHYRRGNTCRKDKLHYPTFKTVGDAAIYYQSLDEVECHMQSLTDYVRDKDDSFIYTYAYVVLEIPLGIEINECLDQYLSVRIYLPDGTFWGQSQYANFFPSPIFDTNEYNY